MKNLILFFLIFSSFCSFSQKKDSTHHTNRETVFDFDKVLLIYYGEDPLLRYQVEGQITRKAAEYKIKCVPSVNLIPEGRAYSTVNVDSFKVVLKEKGIDAAITMEVVAEDGSYKKGKKKNKKAQSSGNANNNGDFQFASFALDANKGKALYNKKVKAVYVRIKLVTHTKVIVEETVEIKKPKSNEDAINKLTDWVSKRLAKVQADRAKK
jgi:hypothetical protein